MKRNLAVILLILTAIILTGCQLANNEAAGDNVQDKLVGVYLTDEYVDLFDFDAYLQANGLPKNDATIDTDVYQGRLYAEGDDNCFAVTGVAFYHLNVPETATHEGYQTTICDDAVTDVNSAYDQRDDGSRVVITGHVYAQLDQHERVYYFNPVYQDADGRIYLMSGSGFSVSDSISQVQGEIYSQAMTETYTQTIDGKSETENFTVKLAMGLMHKPASIKLLQMDAQHNLISQTACTPEQMPETLEPLPDTAYIMIETVTEKDVISRDILDRGTALLKTYKPGTIGLLECVLTTVKWAN